MSNPNCPKCGDELVRVEYPRGSYLSRDQFESVKAGDWFCTQCSDDKAMSGYAYFWDKDLPVTTAPTVPLSELEQTKLKLASAEAELKNALGCYDNLKKLHADTEAKLADALADAASWQKQADDRLNDAVEFGRRAEKAEARVKELEGLIVIGGTSAWVKVLCDQSLDDVPPTTLGEAIPRKDS